MFKNILEILFIIQLIKNKKAEKKMIKIIARNDEIVRRDKVIDQMIVKVTNPKDNMPYTVVPFGRTGYWAGYSGNFGQYNCWKRIAALKDDPEYIRQQIQRMEQLFDKE
jgi:hypothetical protein